MSFVYHGFQVKPKYKLRLLTYSISTCVSCAIVHCIMTIRDRSKRNVKHESTITHRCRKNRCFE